MDLLTLIEMDREIFNLRKKCWIKGISMRTLNRLTSEMDSSLEKKKIILSALRYMLSPEYSVV